MGENIEKVPLAPICDPESISTIDVIQISFHDKLDEACTIISECLNEREKDFFMERTQFGPLVLYAPYVCRSNMIIWYLHLRQASRANTDEVWMIVNNRPLRFSLFEFSLITGLNCRNEKKQITTISTEFCTRVFQKPDGVTVSELVDKMRSLQTQDFDLDKVKLAALYIVSSVILPVWKITSLVDHRWLTLIEDFDEFNKYPWGKESYEVLVSSLYRDIYKKDINHKTRSDANVGGFVLPLQIFAYESIPVLAKRYVIRKEGENLPLPRICRWKNVKILPLPRICHWKNVKKWPRKHPPRYNYLRKVIVESQDITCLLTPTPEELLCDYTPINEASLESSNSTTANIYRLAKEGKEVFCTFPAIQNATHDAPSIQISKEVRDFVANVTGSLCNVMKEGFENILIKIENMDNKIGNIQRDVELLKNKSAAHYERNNPTDSTIPIPQDTPSPFPTDFTINIPQATPTPFPTDFTIHTPFPTDSTIHIPQDNPTPFPTDLTINIPQDNPTSFPTDSTIHIPQDNPTPIPTDLTIASFDVECASSETPALRKRKISEIMKEKSKKKSKVNQNAILEDKVNPKGMGKMKKMKKLDQKVKVTKVNDLEDDENSELRPPGERFDFECHMWCQKFFNVSEKTEYHLHFLIQTKKWLDVLYNDNSWISNEHIDEALYVLLEVQKLHPEDIDQDIAILPMAFVNSCKIAFDGLTGLQQIKNLNEKCAELMEYVSGTKARWPSKSWSEAKTLLMPCHVMDKHWVALKVLKDKKKIIIYDSNRYATRRLQHMEKELEPISFMIVRLLSEAGIIPVDENVHWPFFLPTNYPQNSTGTDCGVYVIRTIDAELHGENPFMLADRFIPNYRRFMTCCIASRKFKLAY